MSERENARTRAFEIIDRQSQLINKALPGYSERLPVAKIAEAYFTPIGESAVADRIRAQHQALSTLLEPGGDYEAAAKYLGETGMSADDMRGVVRAGSEGWAGPGWSHSERQAHIDKHGSEPGPWQLAPGDHQNYQRRLDSWFLAQVAKAHAPQQQKPADILALADSPRVFDDETKYHRALANATATYQGARGEGNASGLLGSKYPWHQGGDAVSDALSSTASPIGSFFSKNNWIPDAIGFFKRTDREPISSGATLVESRRNFMRPSPEIPDGTPEQRQAYMAQIREALTGPQSAYAPSHSQYIFKKYGSPPPYASELATQFLESLPDTTTAAMMFSPKLLMPIAKTAARSGVPVVSRYGAHIARKTAPGVAIGPMAIARNETKEDVPFMMTMMGLDQAAKQVKPSPSQSFSGGIENRPDMPESHMSEDERRQYWAMKDQRLEDSHKFLEQANRNHSDSSLKSPVAGLIDPVAFTAHQGATSLGSAAGTANKANRGSWFPSVPIMPMR